MEKQGFGHTGPRNIDPGALKWQVRINLSASFAAAARANPADPVLRPVLDVLAKYDGVLKHQTMSFGGFLPYFEKEELPLHEAKIAAAFAAVKAAVQGDDVQAGIDAKNALRDAHNALTERLELYLWTKDAMQKPETEKRYATRFTIFAGGQEVYDKAVADGLEADLKALMASGVVTNVNKFDSDPAHNPQPSARFK